jgi:hypothetical protein
MNSEVHYRSLWIITVAVRASRVRDEAVAACLMAASAMFFLVMDWMIVPGCRAPACFLLHTLLTSALIEVIACGIGAALNRYGFHEVVV